MKCKYKECTYWTKIRCLKYESCAYEQDLIIEVQNFLKVLQRKENHYLNKDDFDRIDKSIDKLSECI